jgi:hypothetical protein
MKRSNKLNLMSPDEFEKKLRQQPMRQIPSGWRDEILSAASKVSSTRHATRNTPALLLTLSPSRIALKLWQELVWPCRRIWAGMAVVWVAVLICNRSMEETPRVAFDRSPATTSEMAKVLKEQKQMLSQLLGSATAAQSADLPQPHSKLRESIQAG